MKKELVVFGHDIERYEIFLSVINLFLNVLPVQLTINHDRPANSLSEFSDLRSVLIHNIITTIKLIAAVCVFSDNGSSLSWRYISCLIDNKREVAVMYVNIVGKVVVSLSFDV